MTEKNPHITVRIRCTTREQELEDRIEALEAENSLLWADNLKLRHQVRELQQKQPQFVPVPCPYPAPAYPPRMPWDPYLPNTEPYTPPFRPYITC